MKHVIALSGGKDSTALALRLLEIEPRDYDFIGNWTGNELPEFFLHLRKLESIIGKEIIPVRHSTDLYGVIDQEKMLPSFRARFCTRILKIEPTIAYLEALPEDAILYVGLRADEELRRGLFGEEINVRFPMREWGWNESDVWKYLDSKAICIPKRTDCAVCPYQRLEEWKDLWLNHPEAYAKGVEYEKKYGHTFRSAQRDTWPASLEDLAKEFASNRPLRKFNNPAKCRVCSL